MHNLLILSVVIGGLAISLLPYKEACNRRISKWAGLNLLLYGALRSTSVGTDVSAYANAYLSLPYLMFRDIFTSSTMISRDPFFYLFMKMLTLISQEPQFMIVVVSAVVAICFSVFVYRNSVNPTLSFAMFIGLRYYSFTLSGLRQALAWSIIMLSYELIKKKKPWQFLAAVALAALFHRSAILFVFAYPLGNMRKIGKMTLLVITIMFANFVTNHILLGLLVKLPLLQQYEQYLYKGDPATTGRSTLIIYLLILTFAFVKRKQLIKKTGNFHIMYNLSVVGVAIITLASSYANIFRIGYYFVFPIVILLPASINALNKKYRMLVNILVLALLTFQFMIIGPGAGTDNYQFFWK